ncbi:hypothetical protein AYO22_10190 [Fonsecaea multimorphosa]|nr:hypothetical protein AYO22_10190 [Fonsecaea multimorphosa]
MPTNRPFFANFFSAFRARTNPAFQAKSSSTYDAVDLVKYKDNSHERNRRDFSPIATSAVKIQLYHASSFLVQPKFTQICNASIQIAGDEFPWPAPNAYDHQPINVTARHVDSND